jgi:hypothetical protein
MTSVIMSVTSSFLPSVSFAQPLVLNTYVNTGGGGEMSAKVFVLKTDVSVSSSSGGPCHH